MDFSGITLNTGTGDVPTQWYAAVGYALDVTRTFKVFAICE